MDQRDEFQRLLGRVLLLAHASGYDPQRAAGLSTLELRVLVKLVFDGPTCMRDLGSELSLPRSTMTDAADRLESKQLISRTPDPRDRRCVVLEASEAALFTLSQVTGGLGPVAEALLDDLSESETRELVRILAHGLDGVF
jgi:DNA-binding MarR family transcriptional regulator